MKECNLFCFLLLASGPGSEARSDREMLLLVKLGKNRDSEAKGGGSF